MPNREVFAAALVSVFCACSPGAGAFEYSQFSPKGTKFAPPDTNRIAEIAARLPEKPGWNWRNWCSDARCIGVRPLRRGIGSADVEGAHPAGVATVDKGGSRHGRRGGAMMRRAGDAD